MGISERREREKAERRTAILNCAKELILVQGVEHLSMESIASKAEISKATVYLYFSSKEDLLKEICEEAAKLFHEHLKTFPQTGLKGMAAIRYLWRAYVELFGQSNEMIIVFQVRSFMNSWMSAISLESEDRSPYIDNILLAIKALIDECKAEGIFAPNLDTTTATRLLLSLFSIMVEQASRLPQEIRASPAIIEEMTNTFQIIIRGFAREGIEHSVLNIMG
ncbi:MAG: TetR/AcrR family transcriptional regulator [Treponema sp.]|nr:TetR/AcrR family transcriptional regulator [Treponema sp.]